MNQTTQMIFMGIFFFGITISIHYYLWIRLVRDPALVAPWNYVATTGLILLATSIPITMFFARQMPFETSRIVTYVPYLWMGVMMLLFFAFLSIDLVKGVVYVTRKLFSPDSITSDPSRRTAMAQMTAGGIAFLVSGAAGAGVVQAARKAAVKRIPIGLKDFPAKLNGLKIVQISDLHIGITVGGKWLENLVARINALKPDVVAITGDLTDGDPDQLFEEIAPLANLKSTYGTYFVTGNHEYYSNANKWIHYIKKLGVRVLRNESVQLGDGTNRFHLAGVDDYTADRLAPGHGQDITAAVKGIPKDESVVLLAHQPKAVIEAAKKNVALVLSGHTHGGQIFPFSLLVGLQQPYNKGLYHHSENTDIYVNQGTFMWGPPMRLGTECEITELILERKTSE